MRCTKCGKILSSVKRLQQHIRLHSTKQSFSCRACRNSYKHLSNLKYHKCKLHSASFCTVCQQQFGNPYIYKLHTCPRYDNFTPSELCDMGFKRRRHSSMLHTSIEVGSTDVSDKQEQPSPNMCVMSHGILTPKTSPNGLCVDLNTNSNVVGLDNACHLRNEGAAIAGSSLIYTPEYHESSEHCEIPHTSTAVSSHQYQMSQQSLRFSLESVEPDEMSDDEETGALEYSTSSFNSMKSADPMFQSTDNLDSSFSLSIQVDDQSESDADRVAPNLTAASEQDGSSQSPFEDPPCLEPENNLSPLHVDEVCDKELLESPFCEVMALKPSTSNDAQLFLKNALKKEKQKRDRIRRKHKKEKPKEKKLKTKIIINHRAKNVYMIQNDNEDTQSYSATLNSQSTCSKSPSNSLQISFTKLYDLRLLALQLLKLFIPNTAKLSCYTCDIDNFIMDILHADVQLTSKWQQYKKMMVVLDQDPAATVSHLRKSIVQLIRIVLPNYAPAKTCSFYGDEVEHLVKGILEANGGTIDMKVEKG